MRKLSLHLSFPAQESKVSFSIGYDESNFIDLRFWYALVAIFHAGFLFSLFYVKSVRKLSLHLSLWLFVYSAGVFFGGFLSPTLA